jgi:hypothetical protein
MNDELTLIKEKVRENFEEEMETLRGLVAIKSVAEQPDDGQQPSVPFGKGVADAFRFMLDKGTELGFESVNVDNYGGHIEFGETGREALEREIREELGVVAKTGRFLGVVENSFFQHEKPHSEINLVYELIFTSPVEAKAVEDWIEFEWVKLEDLDSAKILPEVFNELKNYPDVFFQP